MVSGRSRAPVPGEGERRGVGPARRDQHLVRCRPAGLGTQDHQAARADLPPRLTSEAWMILTSPLASDVSGMPA